MKLVEKGRNNWAKYQVYINSSFENKIKEFNQNSEQETFF